MAKINFKQFKYFTDITQEHTDVIDVSRVFADMLYQRGSGIVIHDLALRIYRSKGEMELNQEELTILQKTAEQLCTPVFIDSFKANIIND